MIYYILVSAAYQLVKIDVNVKCILKYISYHYIITYQHRSPLPVASIHQ